MRANSSIKTQNSVLTLLNGSKRAKLNRVKSEPSNREILGIFQPGEKIKKRTEIINEFISKENAEI